MVIDRCIVSVAVGPGFERGLRRLAASLATVGYEGSVAFWNGEYPPGSPAHDEVPYAFKVHALELAAKQGHDAILWCDSSVWFVRRPDEVFDVADEQGCYAHEVVNGYKLGTWCSDTTLDVLGLSRGEAFDVPLVYGGFYALGLRRTAGKMLLWNLSKRARDGSFLGCWTNAYGEASTDPRVRGHRHDQSVLSALLYQRHVPLDKPPGRFVMDAHEGRTEKTVAVCRGLA